MATSYKQENYPKAASVNIFDYLIAEGYKLRPEGNDYAIVWSDASGEHDSLKATKDGTKISTVLTEKHSI